jgi:hypothetical protein
MGTTLDGAAAVGVLEVGSFCNMHIVPRLGVLASPALVRRGAGFVREAASSLGKQSQGLSVKSWFREW